MTVTGFGGTCRQTGNRLIPQRGAPCLLRSQDKTRRVADVAFLREGRTRASEKRRGLSLSSRCGAPHMGLAAADTKGQAAKGAVWVKMNVKEKSTGVPDARGSRRRRGGARERHEAVQNQVPDMGLALPKRRPTKKTRGLRFPSNLKPISRYGARTHD